MQWHTLYPRLGHVLGSIPALSKSPLARARQWKGVEAKSLVHIVSSGSEVRAITGFSFQTLVWFLLVDESKEGTGNFLFFANA